MRQRQKKRIRGRYLLLRFFITLFILIIIISVFLFKIEIATQLAVIGVAATILQWLFPFPIVIEDVEEDVLEDRKIHVTEPPISGSGARQNTITLSRNPPIVPTSPFMNDEDWVVRLAKFSMNVEDGDQFEVIDRTSLEEEP